MKSLRNLLFLAIAILGFSMIDVQAQTYSDGKFAAPQSLERKIYKKLARLPYYGVFDHIAFQVSGDTVTLYGSVYNATNRKSAGRYVEDVEGVAKVVNNIEVLPLSSFDDSIRASVYQRFVNSGGLYRYFWEPNPSVRIIVNRGNVTLEGYVANRGDYNLMRVLANGVSGVFSVKNNLIIEKEMVR